MTRRPVLDYATPRPRKRIAFLSRLNPRATPGSVLWRAIRYALITAAFCAAISLFGEGPMAQRSWGALLGLMAGAAVAGAAIEWQIDDESEDDPPSE